MKSKIEKQSLYLESIIYYGSSSDSSSSIYKFASFFRFSTFSKRQLYNLSLVLYFYKFPAKVHIFSSKLFILSVDWLKQ